MADTRPTLDAQLNALLAAPRCQQFLGKKPALFAESTFAAAFGILLQKRPSLKNLRTLFGKYTTHFQALAPVAGMHFTNLNTEVAGTSAPSMRELEKAVEKGKDVPPHNYRYFVNQTEPGAGISNVQLSIGYTSLMTALMGYCGHEFHVNVETNTAIIDQN